MVAPQVDLRLGVPLDHRVHLVVGDQKFQKLLVPLPLRRELRHLGNGILLLALLDQILRLHRQFLHLPDGVLDHEHTGNRERNRHHRHGNYANQLRPHYQTTSWLVSACICKMLPRMSCTCIPPWVSRLAISTFSNSRP